MQFSRARRACRLEHPRFGYNLGEVSHSWRRISESVTNMGPETTNSSRELDFLLRWLPSLHMSQCRILFSQSLGGHASTVLAAIPTRRTGRSEADSAHFFFLLAPVITAFCHFKYQGQVQASREP
ncbi:hypothetical protein M758_2G032700 [Ceratodon purpureus]|uniref:Uncharacterized protein n=1 Tax=Ceratodon purpureus TaxID=3225 RepID=A0A8T0IST3_CERPU|nr:hypothetical protein KC19_2G033500 [Ceratodon purpureus]KAG0625164.1 hypothetical protein M758_2G032700 [Ceratodon purpureus]